MNTCIAPQESGGISFLFFPAIFTTTVSVDLDLAGTFLPVEVQIFFKFFFLGSGWLKLPFSPLLVLW